MRSTSTCRCSPPRHVRWEFPDEHMIDEFNVLLCHGSPVAPSRSSRASSRPSRRANASPSGTSWHTSRWSGTRTCARCSLYPERRRGAASRRAHFHLEPNKKYIVSVGSVGQPRDYDNRASYTVYDTDKKRFEFKRVEYDIETAAEKVLRAKLERNFAHRLFIGTRRSASSTPGNTAAAVVELLDVELDRAAVVREDETSGRPPDRCARARRSRSRSAERLAHLLFVERQPAVVHPVAHEAA